MNDGSRTVTEMT